MHENVHQMSVRYLISIFKYAQTQLNLDKLKLYLRMSICAPCRNKRSETASLINPGATRKAMLAMTS